MTTNYHRIDKFLIQEQTDRLGTLTTVFLDFVPVVQFRVENSSERKLAVVELVERGLCNQKTAGKICGFHRNTVFKLLRTKRLLGVAAMLEDNRGAQAPYKYVNETRSHIKKLQRKHPDWTDQEIAEQAAQDLELEISRSAVARIRTEKQDLEKAKEKEKAALLPDKKSLEDLAQLAQAFDESCPHERQLALNFEQDEQLRERHDEFAQEPQPEVQGACEQAFIERLQSGQRCEFAGGLMHHLFLEEIGFGEMVAPLPVREGKYYQGQDILGTLIHSVLQGVPSIEALKLLNADEFGILSGCPRIPDKSVMRSCLSELAAGECSAELVERFARKLLENDIVDREVLFIDGHFLPYFGLNVIAKGYYTVRRMAMRGNELYAVTGLDGKPLFFITESCELDFRPIIARCADKLKEWGVERPLLVFDRGGYGVHFFHELNRNADFVTWAKHLQQKKLDEIPAEKFTCGVAFAGKYYLVAETTHTVKESPSTAKNEGRDTPTEMELRLVVFEEIESGRRVGIYTNNRTRNAADIVFYMLHRWGDSENFFKEMMARFNLDYHPGYDIKELEKQPLVENPDIPLIKQAIKSLKNKLAKLADEILVLEAKQMKRKDKRRAEKILKQQAEADALQAELQGFIDKLSTLPDKVSILDTLKGKPMNRCDLEKKKLYDFCQFIAYHARERLVELFRTCYDDPRDVKQVLDMITTRGGYVKLSGQTLMVILDRIQNRKHRDAAECLCHLLNRQVIRMAGRQNFKLYFAISNASGL